VNQLSEYFDNYKTIPRIAELNAAISSSKEELNGQIYQEFSLCGFHSYLSRMTANLIERRTWQQ
jgi:hypothetical protein